MTATEIFTAIFKGAYSFPYYPIAYAYCIFRVIKRFKKTSVDVVAYNPEWEIMGLSIISPLFAPIDVILTIISKFKKDVS
jgi:hypothetical protein